MPPENKKETGASEVAGARGPKKEDKKQCDRWHLQVNNTWIFKKVKRKRRMLCRIMKILSNMDSA